MLVLSRNVEQGIRIGNDVLIKVFEAHGGRARIGIAAPDHIRIMRTELLEDGEMPEYEHTGIIPEATDPRVRNQIDKLPVDYLKANLVLCINALMDIRDNSNDEGESRVSLLTLRDLTIDVACVACEGNGSVLCTHCRGGCTVEHPCAACNTSGDEDCDECGGKGVV